MKLEHLAINVADPISVTHWYVTHLGLTIVRQSLEAPFTTFLADDSGQMMIELYNNPPGEVPTYNSMNPLVLHIAFVSDDPASDKRQLMEAGATLESDQVLEDGSRLVMLRDPWGLSVQLCRRAKPMLRSY